ncbi:MAG TPA: hypothetical protein EYQ21_02120 [Flavobacteriales bacterium]|nr:hypothetical protein [Flavobacteriales bacterium]
MKITQNLETDEVRKCHTIEIKLSNGDEIWIYDDNDGYGSVDIDRHDHGDTSLVTSSTERPRSVRRGRRVYKKREISLSRWDGNDTYRTTVEVGHFFDKQ